MRSVILRSFVLSILLLSGATVFAQLKEPSSPTTDEIFQNARQLGFSGKREEARSLCRTILDRSPDYHDARLLLGRLFSWDGQYDLARAEIKRVLDAQPTYEDARDALIDVERWAGNRHEALALCETGLDKNARSEVFLYKKALVLESLNEWKEATTTVKKLLDMNPAHPDGLTLLHRLDRTGREYKVTLDYTYDVFDKTFDPWHQFSVSVSRHLSFGSIIGRVNYAHRFGQDAAQYEVDAYPRLRSGTYAYLNTGYSPDSIFPEFRFGGELYQSLPRAFEASAGLRHLRFSGEGVTIYTGSLGKYYRDYWFSFRPYLTPGSLGSSVSFQGSVRRYFEDADNYMTVIFGAGSFPDERNTTLDTFRLKSARISVDGRFRIGQGMFGTALFGFDSQQIDRSNRRQHYAVGFSFEKTF